MKRSVAAAMMLAVALGSIPALSAKTGAPGVITGTMRGPAGPAAGVTVNVLNARGTIVGRAVTSGSGAYTLDGLSAGTYTVQALGASGTVLSTSVVTLAANAMTASTTLLAPAAAAPQATQATAVGATGLNAQVVWWTVGATAAAAGIMAAVAVSDPVSPTR